MGVLAANDHSVYAGSDTGFVHKINADATSATTQIEGAKVLDIGLSNENIYVLTHRKEIHEICANTLTVKRAVPLTYDGKCLTYIKTTDEVWVGDKAGNMHILAAPSLEQTSEFLAFPQFAADVICCSADGTKVVAGDHKRNVKVYDSSSKEEQLHHGHHKNFVAGVCFTADGTGIASISDDHSLVVCDLGTKKHFSIPRIHADKRVNSITMTADRTVYTVGDDCQVREWPASDTWDKIPA